MTDDPRLFDNETLRTIRNRHSIRGFTHDDLSDAIVKTLLEAANNAPSAHNQQSWRFIIIRGQKKQEMADLIAQRASSFPRPASALLRMASRSIVSAPVVIGVVNTGELIEHGTELFKVGKDMAYDFFRTMEIQSSAAAVQNLLLAATSMSLASVWLGILFLLKDEVRDFLGEPKGEFMAVIPVGYAARPGTGPQKQPVDAKIRHLS